MIKNNEFTFKFTSDRNLTHREKMKICRISHKYLRNIVKAIVKDNCCDYNSTFGFKENKKEGI